MDGMIVDCLLGLISVFGWLIMSMYLGTGLIFLPFDLIKTWYEQPKPMSPLDFRILKKNLIREISKKIEDIKDLKSKEASD
jgi:hypothetical protein